ncbi:MAG: 50S ribosomal protein L23 [Candidatus Nealsonbacteria bacterium]|nr:50S ribosomal protein L23 [Candidatus Nealsonbacteria bacterium]
MAIFDIFKKKKRPTKDKLTKDKPTKDKPEIKKLTNQNKAKLKPEPTKVKISGLAYRALKTPHVTEKASDLNKKNQYVFKIFPRANKAEVKKAIEDVFKVNVLGVKIINVPKKKRRMGRIKGFRKGYKKAIIRIKKDQKIEVL